MLEIEFIRVVVMGSNFDFVLVLKGRLNDDDRSTEVVDFAKSHVEA
jgi:hypothetical protein